MTSEISFDLEKDILNVESEIKSNENFLKDKRNNVALETTINNFEGFLKKHGQNQAMLFGKIAALEDNVKEPALVKLCNRFIQYLKSERDCTNCYGNRKTMKVKPKGKNLKTPKDFCSVCLNKGIKKGIADSSCKTYMVNFRGFLDYYGFHQVTSKGFAKKIILAKQLVDEKKTFDYKQVKALIDVTTLPRRKCLYGFLATALTRIGETLQLKKKDISFQDVNGRPVESYESKTFRKVVMHIPAEITKTGEARITFVSDQIVSQFMDIVKTLEDDDCIFTTADDFKTAMSREQASLVKARTKLGLKDKKWLGVFSSGRHHFTIHTFRKFGIINADEVKLGFGHSIAGHGVYMRQYRNYTPKRLLELYNKAEQYLSIDGEIKQGMQNQELVSLRESNDSKDEEIERQEQIIKEMKKDQKVEMKRMVEEALRNEHYFKDAQ